MDGTFLKQIRNAKRLPEILVFTGLLLLTIFLLYESRGYSKDARLIPTYVLVTLAILIAIRLFSLIVKDYYPQLLSFASEGKNSGDSKSDLIKDLRPDRDSISDPRMEFRAISWVVVFSVTYYLFGLLIPTPILLFVFLLIEYDGTFKRVLLVTFAWSAMIFILFDFILNVRLYEGVIPLRSIIESVF